MNDIEQSEDAMYTHEVEDWSAFTSERIERLIQHSKQPALGYLVWTKQNHDEKTVQEYIEALKARNISHIRTGLSWAEWFHPERRKWIHWYMREYAKHLTILPCLTFTPPELGVKPSVNAPPRDTRLYAKFVHDVLSEIGELFEEVELWNEWNINTDWDPELDPEYDTFVSMIMLAAPVVRKFGKRVVLGGPSKVNVRTLQLFARFAKRGLTSHADVLGFHNLRGTWSDHVASPPLGTQAHLLKSTWGSNIPVWLTEYGFPVADPENRFHLEELETIQVALFAYAVYGCLTGDFERAYWYTYKDEVHESLRFITTGWEDVLQFYYGDTEESGRPRLLADLLCKGGPNYVLRYAVKENLMPLVDRSSLGRILPR